MSNVFLSDILAQPASMRAALTRYAAYGDLLASIGKLSAKRVLFTGMGSSHYCSQGAVIRLNQGGVQAMMESASEILHYEMGAISADTLLVLTSQSGESGEIVDIIARLPREQTVIGITNNPASALGRRANYLLEMHVEDELAVSTRTYLASLILSDLLASALLRAPCQPEKWERAVDALEDFIGKHQEMAVQIVEHLGESPVLCYLGRGFSRQTAECGALFTRETAKYPALAFDSGEFRHGPFEMIDAGFRAMLFAPGGCSFRMQTGLAQAIAEYGGKCVFVTDQPVSFDDPAILVLRHQPVEEACAPLVQIVGAQLFANEAALLRGHAPGVFRHASKITTAQ